MLNRQSAAFSVETKDFKDYLQNQYQGHITNDRLDGEGRVPPVQLELVQPLISSTWVQPLQQILQPEQAALQAHSELALPMS